MPSNAKQKKDASNPSSDMVSLRPNSRVPTPINCAPTTRSAMKKPMPDSVIGTVTQTGNSFAALAVHDSDDDEKSPSVDKDVLSIILDCHQDNAVKRDYAITTALAEITSSTTLLESTLSSIKSGLKSTTEFMKKSVDDDKARDLRMEKAITSSIENGLKSGFQVGFHTGFSKFQFDPS